MWALTPPELMAALQDMIPAAVETWAVASASVAADWYDELRDRNGIGGTFRAIVYPTEQLGATALAGWAVEPLRLVEPDVQAARYRAEGGLQKRIANHANHTLTGSSAEDPAARGYARLTRPGACDFCRMVASRGGVYTKATGTFACHENCYCSAVPAWGGKPIPVGKYKPSDRPNNEQERERVHQWIADNLN